MSCKKLLNPYKNYYNMSYNIGIETKIQSLARLLDELRQGALQVPPFQRDFVWTRDDIRDLFESIKNNYPIGSLLIWKPQNNYNWDNLKSVGGFELPKNTSQQVFLLDGYQRMSSLFGCLTNAGKTNLKVDETVDRLSLYGLFFDLEEENFVYLRYAPKPFQIPVYILMSTSDFRQYSRKYIEPYCDEEMLNLYLDRADAFSRTLIDYKLAVVEISEANLSDAVNIFSRINSKGTDISYDYMVNALSYSSDFSFSIEIDNVKEQLSRYHFDGISRNNLFRCYQSAFDDKMYFDQSNIVKLAQRPDFKSMVKNISPCILKAVEFLYKELNVVDYKLLPYNIQLIFVMKFFIKLNNPTKNQLQELKRWFWITTYSNYFTTYSLSNQRKAYEQFLNYLDGNIDDSVFSDNPSVPFRTMPFPKIISLSTVRSKALILFELHLLRKRSRTNPTIYGLTLGKLCSKLPSSPENIVPTYIAKKNQSFHIDSKQLNILDDISYNHIHLLPPTDQYENLEDFLKKRKELIIQEEQSFVEKLGMDYIY